MPARHTAAVTLALLASLVACHAPVSNTRPDIAHAAGPHRKSLTFGAGGPGTLRLSYPASWRAYKPTDYNFTFDTMLAYVGNITFSDPCRHYTNKYGAQIACRPFGSRGLPPNGVAVAVDLHASTAATASHPLRGLAGTLIQLPVGPAREKITFHHAFGCPRNTGRSIQDFIYLGQRGNYLIITECLRGPNVLPLQREGTSLLRSIRYMVGR